jgi:polyisoprenoid-binding protein YceI
MPSRVRLRLLPLSLITLLAACGGDTTGSVAASSSAPAATAAAPAGTAAAATAASHAASGALVLDAADSRLSFVSIKNNSVIEAHTFGELSGRVAADGQASLEIALDSVQTGIELRDQRMRELLFQTGTHPKAVITLALDMAKVRDIPAGAHQLFDLEATLAVHGTPVKLPAQLRVTRTGAAQWLVTSEKPVLVNAAECGLADGVEALRNVVALQSIAGGVPVSFALAWRAE